MRKLFSRLQLSFNRLSRRFFYFLASPAKWKFLLFFFFAIAVITSLIIWKPDYAMDIINTAFGFFLGSVGIYFIGVLRRSTEDYNKVINDVEFLKKRGYDSQNIINFSFNETTIEDFFDCCYASDGDNFKVVDKNDKMFEPDGLIVNSFFDIMKSHGGSYKHNEITVRLDDYTRSDDGEITLYTSRSTVFNHLITNRAIDYYIQGHMTLRDIYESEPSLTSLAKSKMSNHIGINAFLIIECGNKKYLVLPKRGKTSTISKGLVTSSIASRLILDNPQKNISGDSKIPFREQVCSLLRDKLSFCEQLNGKQKIHFLGFGRNLYEGGKPQFYYCVRMSCSEVNIQEVLLNMKKCKQTKEQLDLDIGLMLIELDSLKYCKHDTFKAKRINLRRNKEIYFTVEKSFLANLYLFDKKNKAM
jgi:hypothetical protein